MSTLKLYFRSQENTKEGVEGWSLDAHICRMDIGLYIASILQPLPIVGSRSMSWGLTRNDSLTVGQELPHGYIRALVDSLHSFLVGYIPDRMKWQMPTWRSRVVITRTVVISFLSRVGQAIAEF